MAVQKNRKTRAKRNMRRAHDHLRETALSSDFVTGMEHRRHHISPEGFYRGREVIPMPVEDDDDIEES